jgi:ATP-dependent Clp protease protease subunit
VRDETNPQERTLRLEGAIAEESWFDDEITPKVFRQELFDGDGPITVWINSPGGDCVAAAQIYNMLMDYPHDITVKVDGLAASAASVIAMAGTRVVMTPVSLMMIHNPLTVAMGDSDEMRRAIQLLDEVKESILNAYEIKTGLSRARLSHLMDGETWMNAKKAVELGFADVILYEGKKEEQAAEEPPTEDAEIEAQMYSTRVMDMAILNRLGAIGKAPEPPSAPIIGMDGKTEDGAVPYQILRNQLDFLR